MEDKLSHLNLGVSRIRDLRTVLLAWDEVLILAYLGRRSRLHPWADLAESQCQGKFARLGIR